MQCRRNWKRGWWCSRSDNHAGPCALRPKWWFMVLHGPMGLGWGETIRQQVRP
jgi:hypothetical protein